MIVTNNRTRPILWGNELTPKERAQEKFSWILKGDMDVYEFFRYKGAVYCLQSFVQAPSDFAPWEGYKIDEETDTAILIRFTDGITEEVVVGRLAL
jgi:hypothetical protein